MDLAACGLSYMTQGGAVEPGPLIFVQKAGLWLRGQLCGILHEKYTIQM